MNKPREKTECVVEMRTGRLDDACRRYNVGSTTMRKLAKDAGAVIHIGHIYLVDFSIVDEYLTAMAGR